MPVDASRLSPMTRCGMYELIHTAERLKSRTKQVAALDGSGFDGEPESVRGFGEGIGIDPFVEKASVNLPKALTRTRGIPSV